MLVESTIWKWQKRNQKWGVVKTVKWYTDEYMVVHVYKMNVCARKYQSNKKSGISITLEKMYPMYNVHCMSLCHPSCTIVL